MRRTWAVRRSRFHLKAKAISLWKTKIPRTLHKKINQRRAHNPNFAHEKGSMSPHLKRFMIPSTPSIHCAILSLHIYQVRTRSPIHYTPQSQLIRAVLQGGVKV